MAGQIFVENWNSMRKCWNMEKMLRVWDFTPQCFCVGGKLCFVEVGTAHSSHHLGDVGFCFIFLQRFIFKISFWGSGMMGGNSRTNSEKWSRPPRVSYGIILTTVYTVSLRYYCPMSYYSNFISWYCHHKDLFWFCVSNNDFKFSFSFIFSNSDIDGTNVRGGKINQLLKGGTVATVTLCWAAQRLIKSNSALSV